ncbi:MAG: beta-keto acid cleavage family enzyme [Gemmatimonadales bacterium]
MSKYDYLWRYADTHQYLERVGKMPPVIIVCACNGGVQGKESNDHLPETADEIADSVYGAYQAGASMVHVHARNPENHTRPATTTEVWLEVNRKIRERCPDIIINNTTGGGPSMTMEERLQCLPARPEVASLNLTPDMSKFKLAARKPPLPFPRDEILYDECLPFSYRLVNQFAAEMKKWGVKPELETYHSGGPWVIRDLIQGGMIEAPYWIQTVMGYQTSSWPTFESVIQLVREMPENTLWLTSGIGPHQLPMTTFAMLLGGHVRVGLEDNVYFRRGQKATGNAQLVARAAHFAEELNRGVATPAEARRMLGLSATPSSY